MMVILILVAINFVAWFVWNYVYFLRARDATQAGEWRRYRRLPGGLQRAVDVWDWVNALLLCVLIFAGVGAVSLIQQLARIPARTPLAILGGGLGLAMLIAALSGRFGLWTPPFMLIGPPLLIGFLR